MAPYGSYLIQVARHKKVFKGVPARPLHFHKQNTEVRGLPQEERLNRFMHLTTPDSSTTKMILLIV